MSIGISFGSPTSGAGFDVSTTVSQIMANMQNVETPWKTKLSSLESQSSVISNLGTLLSAVSNDISELTDVTGIMSDKTGSSSDTSIVELSSATTSAQAGTHTIVVKNMATSSSGYLTAITNSADTLSGSLTIQVGTATAQTITVDSNSNTLSTLATAINNANLGVTANVLTDSSGSRLSLVSGTSGAGGNITVTSTLTDASNSSSSLSYTTSATGKDASLTVDGIDLTSSTNTISNMIPGITFQILATSSKDSAGDYNATSVVIGNNTTGVESALNSFVNDYNSLVSAMNTQEGNDASGNAEPLFGSPTLSLLQQQLSTGLNKTNASGYLTPVSASSTLSGSIVVQVGTATAHTISITSSNNTLAKLATSINSSNLGVTAAVSTMSTGSYLELTSSTSGSSGALKISSSLTATSGSTTTAMTYTNSSDITTLSSLGITVSASSDGTLSLNLATLNSALNSDYSSVMGFFQNIGSWGSEFSSTISNVGTSSTSGVLALELSSISTSESSLHAQISREESLISAEQVRVTKQLTSANQVLQAIPQQLSEVNEIYSAISGYNQSSS